MNQKRVAVVIMALSVALAIISTLWSLQGRRGTSTAPYEVRIWRYQVTWVQETCSVFWDDEVRQADAVAKKEYPAEAQHPQGQYIYGDDDREKCHEAHGDIIANEKKGYDIVSVPLTAVLGLCFIGLLCGGGLYVFPRRKSAR